MRMHRRLGGWDFSLGGIFKGVLVELDHEGDLFFPGKIFEGVAMGAGTFGCFALGFDFTNDGFCKDFMVIDGDQRSDGFIDEVGEAAGIGGDYGGATCKGFDGDEAEGFNARWNDGKVGGVINTGYGVLILVAKAMNALQVKICDAGLHFVP